MYAFMFEIASSPGTTRQAERGTVGLPCTTETKESRFVTI